MPEHAPGTRVVRAGLPPPAQGQPFLPGPELAGPYHLAGDPHSTPYNYGRYANRTVALYEQALTELEGGETAVFASGMAACSAVLLPLLAPGDLLVAAADGYPVVRKLVIEHLAPRGVEVRWVPTAEFDGADLAGARLVWLETPSNPGLEVCDVAAISERAHAAGALVAVDNTLATPLDQRPLELGADISVASGTKALTGHSDILLGYVSCGDAGLAAAVRDWRGIAGGILGPFEAWLAHRSLATLGVRLERQRANAHALADALRGRDEVTGVRYPGLGPVLVFELSDEQHAERFFAASALVIESTSFGGIHTTAERRARWGQGDEVAAGFIRMSAGIEEPADLVADIEAALDVARRG